MVLLREPLQPLPIEDFTHARVLFHYTGKDGFYGIGGGRNLWATLLKTNKNVKDTCFGDGVYATSRGPDEFGSMEAVATNNFSKKEAVLINNFTNAPHTEPEKQRRHIQSHLAQAD